MVRHVGVDLARQFDETRTEVTLFGFPGKIERIYWDAVSAKSRSRIKRMEAERLGGGSLNHFPYVYAHPQAQQLEFIDQRNVHAAVDVFEKLGHLRRRRRRNRHDAVENCTVERAR